MTSAITSTAPSTRNHDTLSSDGALHAHTERRAALGLLARAPAEHLAACVADLGPLPEFTWLRQPECGTVLLRGRIGGDGARFNLGEATMTRCTLRLSDGTVGVGAVRGRSARQAQLIALCDAMLQQPAVNEKLTRTVIAPLAKLEAERHAAAAAKVAASRVDFYTMVRGED